MSNDLIDPCTRLIRYLESKNDILLLTTSTRYRAHTWDTPKTTALASRIKEHLKRKEKRVILLDVAKLRIHTCEGNISAGRGNNCGVREAKLLDRAKNPTGHHRCWASINNVVSGPGQRRRVGSSDYHLQSRAAALIEGVPELGCHHGA